MKNKTDTLRNVINILQKTFTSNEFKLITKNLNFCQTTDR